MSLQLHLVSEGLPEVRFDELRSAATHDATRVLEAASQLAAWRVTGANAIATHIDALQRDPWPLPRRRAAQLPARITQTDLVRALVGWAPDALRDAFLAVPAVDHLRAASDGLRASVPSGASAVDGLERCIGIRWELAWSSLTMPVGIEHLLGALDDDSVRALTAFDSDFRAGLITEDQAFHRTLDRRRGVTALPGVPRVVGDRTGTLGRIESALQEAPVVCLVAKTAHSGRRTLVEHILGRAHYRGTPPGLAQFHIGSAWFGLGTAYADDCLFDTVRLSRDAVLWVLVKERHTTITSGRGELGRDSAADLRFALRTALTDPEHVRIVLSLTEAEHAALLSVVPELSSARRVDVPVITERDWLVRWLSLALLTTDDDGSQVDVSEIMSAFEIATVDDRATPERDVLRRWVRRLRADNAGDSWRNLLRRVMSGKSTLGSRREVVERHVGTVEDLRAIAQFSDKLGLP